MRLDAFLCGKLEEASRAKVQASIKEGLVTINGQPLQKAAHAIRLGDVITCRLPTPRRLEAEPEVRCQYRSLCAFSWRCAPSPL